MKKIYLFYVLILAGLIFACEKQEETTIDQVEVDIPDFIPNKLVDYIESQGQIFDKSKLKLISYDDIIGDPKDFKGFLKTKEQPESIKVREVQKSTSKLKQTFIHPECDSLPEFIAFDMIRFQVSSYKAGPNGTWAYIVSPLIEENPYVVIDFTTHPNDLIFNCPVLANSDPNIDLTKGTMKIVREGHGNFTPLQLLVKEIRDDNYVFVYEVSPGLSYALDAIRITDDTKAIYVLENLDYEGHFGWFCWQVPMRLVMDKGIATVGEKLDLLWELN